jgi:hypothetical protein
VGASKPIIKYCPFCDAQLVLSEDGRVSYYPNIWKASAESTGQRNSTLVIRSIEKVNVTKGYVEVGGLVGFEKGGFGGCNADNRTSGPPDELYFRLKIIWLIVDDQNERDVQRRGHSSPDLSTPTLGPQMRRASAPVL